ncbi:hypothetical protein KW823_26630, partial [Enterobacter quasiroggenkampii]|nr:hypothetical protein [Enterobacter quasiroggenkampii]
VMTYLSIFSFRNKGTEHQHKSWCGDSELTLGIHSTNESRGMNTGVSLPEKKRWDFATKALLYATKCVKQGLIS